MSIYKPSPLAGFTRRQFLYSAALAAGATAFAGFAQTRPTPRRLGAGDKLNIGFVGVTGKGGSDLSACAVENVVALCDVDERSLNSAHAKHPDAKTYKDFRKMLETEKSLDAVVISTPDHLHATIAAMAIRMGKHVYCQKPLTQTVYEARLLRKLAKEYGVATQMGNQGSAGDGLRRAVEVIQSGLIGQVRQLHVWSNRPIWRQGMDRPAGSDPIPESFDWDLWLGPAPFRPFKATYPGEQAPAEAAADSKGKGKGKKSGNSRGSAVYHPFVWRGWQDFGTGALGDMACHTVNMPFRALKLGYPTEIEAECSGINTESYPKSSKIRFEFPERDGLVPLSFFWYDGGRKPTEDLTADVKEMLDKVPGSGCLLIGDKGTLFSGEDYGARFSLKLKDEKELVDGANHPGVKAVPQSILRNEFKGSDDVRHHLEWIAACKGGKPGYSDFDIAAYLTEIILLGCIALRVGKKLEWDGPNMKATNAPEAARFVRRDPRKGWSL
jgi:predicted dehydrogenase